MNSLINSLFHFIRSIHTFIYIKRTSQITLGRMHNHAVIQLFSKRTRDKKEAKEKKRNLEKFRQWYNSKQFHHFPIFVFLILWRSVRCLRCVFRSFASFLSQ